MSDASNRTLIESRIDGGVRRLTTRTPSDVQRIATGLTPSRAERQQRSWKVVVGFGSAVIAIAVAVAFYHPWQTARSSSAAAESHSTAAPKAVMIARPAPAATSSVVLPATIRPWQAATLYARVNGYLRAWHYELGSPVKAGDILAEIETPELDQEVAQNEALASEAAAAAVQAHAERIEAQADLKVAEAQLARVQAEYELTRSQLVRREKLMRSHAISQEEYDTFQRQVEARAADVSAAQSDVARRRTNLDTRAAIIQAREATAKSRRSNVDRLKELQAFKRIVAPFNGAITSRTAEVGMLVTAGKEPLFVVEDLSRIRVHVNVPQTYAMQTAPGVAASIGVPESNLPRVEGEITRIADSVDSSSRTMLVEIELENGTNHFQPGSYAQVTLATPQSSTAWTVPTNTISMRANGPHVALVNEQNQIEIKRVTLGRDLGDRVVVADGIRGNERLVVNPSDDLASGLSVQINHHSELTQKVARADQKR